MAAFTSHVSANIGHIIFNKPPVNAFDSHEWAAIAAEIQALGVRDDVHVIVMSAEGRGFCAGVDIKELGAHPEMIVPVNKGNYDTFEAIHKNPKPVIVALHGFVLGGGIGIAGAADIIVASECATFGVPEVDRGSVDPARAQSRQLLELGCVRHSSRTRIETASPRKPTFLRHW